MSRPYQQIIPLGEECYSCQAIDKKFNKDLRNFSLPFDYVAGTNLCRLMPVFDDIFQDKFSLSRSYLRRLNYGGKFTLQDHYGFIYIHDVWVDEEADIKDAKIDSIVERFNRRYDRLINLFRGKQKILLFSVSHFNKIYHGYNTDKDLGYLNQMSDYLQQAGCDFEILALNYTQREIRQNHITHMSLAFEKDDDIDASKNNFYRRLYEFVDQQFSRTTHGIEFSSHQICD